jgi:hypothetical protein
MCASSREELPPMVRKRTDTSNVMIRMFLGREQLTCVDTLDSNETLTQHHFISFPLSDLKTHAQNLCMRKQPIELAVRMNNQRCHNRHKGVGKVRRNHNHPRYRLT